jgi:carbonic anhydrase
MIERMVEKMGNVMNHDKAAVNVHDPAEAVGDWETALQYLKEGNKRYLDDKTIVRNTNAKDRSVLINGQKPFAIVVTCSDSRVSPEIYFDHKLGDIFVIRNAGNIADATALGSIEYAAEHLKAPLIVVVGHSRCGAVTGAFEGGEYPENLKTIIDAISPAISNCDDVDEAIHVNINEVVNKIKANKIVKEMKTKTIGAYYDIETGEVHFE